MTASHDKYAKDYDAQIEAYGCHLAEVIFGLCYETVRKGESILDVGIGTGISTKLFKLAGLNIYGIDSSKDMLDICRKKNIAEELLQRDILSIPWPYPGEEFNHVVCCGVFHFIPKLDDLFLEVERIQKRGGLFAFTVMKSNNENIQGDYEMRIEDDYRIYSHRSEYIEDLIAQCNYIKAKEITCGVGNTLFRVIVAQKREN